LSDIYANEGATYTAYPGCWRGGFIGLRPALRPLERLRSLILIETSAQPEPKENVPRYRMLNRMVRLMGVGAVKKPVMKIMFGQTFFQSPERQQWKGSYLEPDYEVSSWIQEYIVAARERNRYFHHHT